MSTIDHNGNLLMQVIDLKENTNIIDNNSFVKCKT
jgi:hypothetical protein